MHKFNQKLSSLSLSFAPGLKNILGTYHNH